MRPEANRRKVWALLALAGVACALGCDGCGGVPEPEFELISEGSGPPNAAPLMPLRPGLRLGGTTSPGHPLEPGGVAFEGTIGRDGRTLHRLVGFGRVAYFEQTDQGVILHGVVNTSEESGELLEVPEVFAPATVREGMVWEAKGTRFEVAAPETRQTRWGEATAWTITSDTGEQATSRVFLEGVGLVEEVGPSPMPGVTRTVTLDGPGVVPLERWPIWSVGRGDVPLEPLRDASGEQVTAPHQYGVMSAYGVGEEWILELSGTQPKQYFDGISPPFDWSDTHLCGTLSSRSGEWRLAVASEEEAARLCPERPFLARGRYVPNPTAAWRFADRAHPAAQSTFVGRSDGMRVDAPHTFSQPQHPAESTILASFQLDGDRWAMGSGGFGDLPDRITPDMAALVLQSGETSRTVHDGWLARDYLVRPYASGISDVVLDEDPVDALWSDPHGVWAFGAFDASGPLGRPQLAFSKLGFVQPRVTATAREALVVDADGVIYRLAMVGQAPRLEHLGSVDLPVGHRAVAATRLGTPNGATDGSDVLVATTRGAEVLPPGGFLDGADTSLWIGRLGRERAVEAPTGAVTARAIEGDDVLVCWPEAWGALEETQGWRLGGHAPIDVLPDDVMTGCALVLRDHRVARTGAPDEDLVLAVLPRVGSVLISPDHQGRLDADFFASVGARPGALGDTLATTPDGMRGVNAYFSELGLPHDGAWPEASGPYFEATISNIELHPTSGQAWTRHPSDDVVAGAPARGPVHQDAPGVASYPVDEGRQLYLGGWTEGGGRVVARLGDGGGAHEVVRRQTDGAEVPLGRVFWADTPVGAAWPDDTWCSYDPRDARLWCERGGEVLAQRYLNADVALSPAAGGAWATTPRGTAWFDPDDLSFTPITELALPPQYGRGFSERWAVEVDADGADRLLRLTPDGVNDYALPDLTAWLPPQPRGDSEYVLTHVVPTARVAVLVYETLMGKRARLRVPWPEPTPRVAEIPAPVGGRFVAAGEVDSPGLASLPTQDDPREYVARPSTFPSPSGALVDDATILSPGPDGWTRWDLDGDQLGVTPYPDGAPAELYGWGREVRYQGGWMLLGAPTPEGLDAVFARPDALWRVAPPPGHGFVTASRASVITQDAAAAFLIARPTGAQSNEDLLCRVDLSDGSLTELGAVPRLSDTGGLAASPDGGVLAYVSTIGQPDERGTYLYDGATGGLIARLLAQDGVAPGQAYGGDAPPNVAFDPKGRYMAATSVVPMTGRETVAIWEVGQGPGVEAVRLIATLPAPSRTLGRMQRLVWLPDGDHVLAISSAFEDAVVAVWEIPSRPWQASLLQETSLSASSTEALADTATLTVSPSGDTFLVRATTNRDAREYGTAFEDVR